MFCILERWPLKKKTCTRATLEFDSREVPGYPKFTLCSLKWGHDVPSEFQGGYIWRLVNHQCKWFLLHVFLLWRGTRKCAVFICCLYIYVYSIYIYIYIHIYIYIICMYSSQIWEFPLNAWWIPQLVTIFLRRCPFRNYHLEIPRGHSRPWKGNPKTQLIVPEGDQHTSTISMC